VSVSETGKPSLSYLGSGVDIDAGNELVRRIGPAVKRTHREGVLGGIGGFGALFSLPLDRYHDPVLVSGTDGVGTKLRLATELNRHDGIGIDLVAMCVNDIVVLGAEPLYFLDYFATGHLNVDLAARVIEGIAEGCSIAGCALAGGETAEMPGMYSGGDYDLAGFAVGIVERDKLPDPSRVKPGQTLIGITSSGPHSNGFSLIRKTLEQAGGDIEAPLGESTLGDALMAPTRIYVRPLLTAMKSGSILTAAHITGGGISENLPRALPAGTCAEVDLATWELPAVFRWIQSNGGIADDEMLRTFNCGVGMVLVVDQANTDTVLDQLADAGETAFAIGRILGAPDSEPCVKYINPW
jgi:phosphoribosylformylglycinamidine cyclo-ligase